MTEGDEREVARDEVGLALGGRRPPAVEVPVRVLSAEPGPNSSAICMILGTSTPLPTGWLGELYASPTEYEELDEAAEDESVEMGLVLEDDRAAIAAYLDPEAVSG